VNGPRKRKSEKTDRELARIKVLKKLLKKKPELEFTDFGDNKFVVARGEKGFAGIFSTAIAPHGPFFRHTTLHVNPKGPNPKIAERYATEVAAYLARELMPNSKSFHLGKVAFGLTIDPMVWERWVLDRQLREVPMEGELAGLVNEALAGRYAGLPLSQDELKMVQEHLHATFLNPYKLSLEEEKQVIEKNLALLKQVIDKGDAASVFTADAMVPFVM
jgi:hypothetical protein